MYAKRREDIMAMLKEKSPLSTREIAERLLVSEMTVRRDLTQMEKEGVVKRSFGAASLSEGIQMEPSILLRASRASEAKRRIAAAAAALVQDGDSVILDVGTTVNEVAKLLSSRPVMIHTSSIPTALCANGGAADVRISGGHMERTYEVLNGPAAENYYQSIFCDFVFVSAAAVSIRHGLTAYTEDDASLKRIMLTRGRKRVLLVDATKFDNVEQFRACGWENIDLIITDSQPGSDYMETFDRLQIKVLLADSNIK